MNKLPREQFHLLCSDPPYEISYGGAGWDSTGVAFQPDTWRAAKRVMKPGAFLFAFSHSRTFHRVWCAIEDAGLRIFDTALWMYTTGFPKGADATKGVDKEYEQMNTRPVLGTKTVSARAFGTSGARGYKTINVTGPTEDSKFWAGWKGGLKPSFEPVCVAQKGIRSKTVGRSLIDHKTGALNIGGCLVNDTYWPPNVIHDGQSIPVGFRRYFFHAKATADDRRGIVEHTTVKPIDVMRWLIRLGCVRGGHVLDPFAGGGSTGEAALLEGMRVTLIELDPKHCQMIRQRFRSLERLHAAGQIVIPGLKGGRSVKSRRSGRAKSLRRRPAGRKTVGSRRRAGARKAG
jgi:site-specific DNA-methyltransferase (adenine-specific)